MGDGEEIALSQLVGALSSALDVGEGEPPGHARRSCLIGMRLAEALELDSAARSDLYYALLLKDAGCSANAAHMAALFGADDQVAKRTSKLVNWARPFRAFVWSLRTVAPDGSLRDRADRLRAIRNEGMVTRKLMKARCHRGAQIARKLGFSAPTADAIRALDEHWDGRGQPLGLQGSEIPLAARILCLSQTVEVFHAVHGPRAACRVAVRRRGEWFDPMLVDLLQAFRSDGAFWASLAEADVSRLEPPDRMLRADEDRLDLVAEGFAAVIDAKSPWTHEHSRRVCEIASGIATGLGFGETERRQLRRAALLHDLGKLSISNRTLDNPDALTDGELLKLRQHPLLTEQILAPVPALRGVMAVACAHHERLDGSGYPHGLAGDQLNMPMRVLAIADAYEALVSDRPYRSAFSSEVALRLIGREVPTRFDVDAFTALRSLLRHWSFATELGQLTGARRSARAAT